MRRVRTRVPLRSSAACGSSARNWRTSSDDGTRRGSPGTSRSERSGKGACVDLDRTTRSCRPRPRACGLTLYMDLARGGIAPTRTPDCHDRQGHSRRLDRCTRDVLPNGRTARHESVPAFYAPMARLMNLNEPPVVLCASNALDFSLDARADSTSPVLFALLLTYAD